MKKIFLLAGIFLLIGFSFAFASVQEEEAEGKEVWKKLLNKTISCDALSDEQLHLLGEYFMGLMAGDSHQSMNEMMERMWGEQGEEQMHIIMGKRMSGCDTNATISGTIENMWGMMPMMTSFGAGSCGMLAGTAGTWNVLNTTLIFLAIAALILLAFWMQKPAKPKKKRKK